MNENEVRPTTPKGASSVAVPEPILVERREVVPYNALVSAIGTETVTAFERDGWQVTRPAARADSGTSS